MTGLFIGLSTLDLIYLADRVPQGNEKCVALDQMISAGGPATNAAITFSHWGSSKLLAIVGNHPLSQVIHQELAHYDVELLDLAPEKWDSPPVSSVIVTPETGERAVLSINATKNQAKLDLVPKDILAGVEIVLIDGHQMEVSVAIAKQAKSQGIPVVVDGGSWKPGFDAVLIHSDYVIASSHFVPPGGGNPKDVMDYLRSLAIPQIAITQGERPIIYCQQAERGEIPIPAMRAIDTLGAGDIFHGAFCHFILQRSFQDALLEAAAIASLSCQYFGPRHWMESSIGSIGVMESLDVLAVPSLTMPLS